VLAPDPDSIRVDLPRPPNRPVDQSCFTATIRCRLRHIDELFSLIRQEGQSDKAGTVNFQMRCKKFDRTGGKEVAGSAN
jgi:hypothetical protein